MSLSVAEKLAIPSVHAPQASLGIALRNILASLALTILTLCLAGSIWREQGYEMLIVAMGWPHVLPGFSFYYFLYFLVFHVTFSFRPTLRSARQT